MAKKDKNEPWGWIKRRLRRVLGQLDKMTPASAVGSVARKNLKRLVNCHKDLESTAKDLKEAIKIWEQLTEVAERLDGRNVKPPSGPNDTEE